MVKYAGKDKIYEEGLNLAMMKRNRKLFNLFYNVKLKKKSRDINFKYFKLIRGEPYFLKKIAELIGYQRV